MAEFEEKLNSILSNPALMSQIMSMAGSMGQSQSQPSAPPPQQPFSQSQNVPFSQNQQYAAPQGMGGVPGFDPAALQGMMQLLKSTQIDQRQQQLLRALEGYLPRERVQKLTKAMQAARIAKYASSALSQGR